MDEKVVKYLKTYGVVAGFAVLIVVLGELGFVAVLTGLLMLISLVMVAAVLIQQGKGGGLVGALGGMSGDTMFGTTATPVKKFTAALGILFVLGVLVLGRAYNKNKGAARPVPAAPAPTREAPVPVPAAPIKVPTAPTPAPK